MGNVGSLTVRPVKLDDESFIQTQQRKNNEFVTYDGGIKVTGAGPARYTKLDLTTGDTLYIGRLPKNPPADLKVGDLLV